MAIVQQQPVGLDGWNESLMQIFFKMVALELVN